MGAYASGFPSSGDEGQSAGDTEDTRGLQDQETDEGEGDDLFNEQDEPLLEGLTKELESKLISLVIDFEQESFPVWRFLNRDFFEAESFWKDLQMGFYDAQADIWRIPSARDLSKIGESGQRFTFQTNVYRGWGGAVISVLGQKIPTTRFLPSDFTRESDILFAESASDVTPLIERWNKLQLKNVKAAYFLYTHGIIGGFTRYLEDAERFGWKEVPEIAYQKAVLQDAGYECMYCSTFSPESDHFQQGGMSDLTGMEHADQTGMSGSDMEPPPVPQLTCPNCSRPLGEMNYRPAEYGEVPVEVATKLVPRGREVLTIHGGLELRLPPWCSEQSDYPYLGLVLEVHVSSLRATYGKRAKNLQGGWGAGPYDSWDRFARLALVEPTVSYYGTSNQNLVTFKRYWLRPSSFWLLKDEKDIQALLKIFPDGAYIAFADTQKLLDARNERLDDHWEIGTAVEGSGAYTPAMGSSTISIQKRFNTVENFIMEWIEYSAAGAGTFVNANVINYKALKSHRRAPGMIYPLRMGITQPIGNVLKEGTPGQMAGEVFRYGDSLVKTGEFLSGAVPTVSGGTEQSLKPTTYISDKESALGRMYTAWLHLRWFWSNLILKSVKDFAKFATYDEMYSIIGPDGTSQGKAVKLDNLRGDLDAYPETNEQFPILWQQMQQTFMQLVEMSAQDEQIASIVGDLENITFAKAMLGLPNLFVPGMDDRLKQKHEISLLLQQKPVQYMNPVQDPETGAAVGMQPVEEPSIPIDPFEDAHPVHILTVKKWAVSSEGLKAKIENPAGYKNVILHGKMHDDYMTGLLAHQQARTEMEGQMQEEEDGSQGGPGAQRSVRRGQSAGANGSKGKTAGKSLAKKGPGKSDNPADAGGASPVEQTKQIKEQMGENLPAGVPSP